MKTLRGLAALGLAGWLGMCGTDVVAATHYVVTNGTLGVTPTDPFTNWATAGTSIQEVVTAALTNTAPRTVWVTNGTYDVTSPRITIDNGLTLKSCNGWSNTVIKGDYPYRTNSAFLINIPGNTTRGIIDGFTITNFGYDASYVSAVYLLSCGEIYNCLITGNRAATLTANACGGGAWLGNYGLMSNCIVRGNYSRTGGGVYFGGAYGKVMKTLVEGNTATYQGGGVYFFVDRGTLTNLTVINNTCNGASGSGLAGGIGAYVYTPGWGGLTIDSCIVTGNTATSATGGNGGGICLIRRADGTYIADPLTIKNTLVQGNSASNSAGGVYSDDRPIVIRNCLIAENKAAGAYGGVFVGNTGMVESCTIANNTSGTRCGGLGFGNTNILIPGNTKVYGTNNIVYFNTAPIAANFTNTAGNTGLNYSCVSPAVDGVGNTAGDPSFKDMATGNYRLHGGSPCVNTGSNQAWMTNTMDIDGMARIRYDWVDMGAYEAIYPSQGTIFSWR